MLLILLSLILFFVININELFNESIINLDNIKKITKKISINRPIESINLKNVKKYIIEELKKINLIVEEQKFTKNNHEFSNIIGINNKHNKYILLSAHVDSINIDAAIDSATSIAIIIEISKKLLMEIPHYPLLIVFFDGEEAVDGPWTKNNTLFGSRYFVDHNNYKIELAYVLDLIGGDIKKNKITAFSNNINSNKHIQQLFNINKTFTNNIFIDPNIYISNKNIEDDHVPFKEKNINYVHLIPNEFPDTHHTNDDNYNNVNWLYIEIFTNVLYEKLKQDLFI